MFTITALQQVHAVETPFICCSCHRRFAHEIYLQRHLRIHKGDARERPYVCSVCSQRFCDKSVLESHHAVHTGQIEFVYSEGNKGFSKNYNQKQSLTPDGGERKIICNLPNRRVAKKSVLKTNLRTHRTSHSRSEENQLKSDEREKKYLHNSDQEKHSSMQKESGLTKHFTHSGGNPSVSDKCNNSKTLPLSGSAENHLESDVKNKNRLHDKGKYFSIQKESGAVKHLVILSVAKRSVSDVGNESETHSQSCSEENQSESCVKDKRCLQDSYQGKPSSVRKESGLIKHPLTHFGEKPSVSDNRKTLSHSWSEENQHKSNLNDKRCLQDSYEGKHFSIQKESGVVKHLVNFPVEKSSVPDVCNERKTQSQSCSEEKQPEIYVKDKRCLEDTYQKKHTITQKESVLIKHLINSGEKPLVSDVCNVSKSQSDPCSGENQHESDVKDKKGHQDSYQEEHSSTQNESGLIQHLVYPAKKSFISDVCNNNNNKSQSYPCSVENQSESCANSSLNQNLSVPSREKPFLCNVCNKTFARTKYLQQHLYTHTGVKPFPCSLCNKSFTTKFGLKLHRVLHTGERAFICNFCRKSFTHEINLKMHLQIHAEDRDRPYVCSVCNQRFYRKNDLKRHNLIHTGEKKFICSECGKGFSTSWNLKLHTTVHSGERKFACNVCNKKFSQKSYLKVHLRKQHKTRFEHTTQFCVHTDKKQFVCDLCYKNICCDSHLKEHIHSHTENNLFVCSQCQKSFREKGDLRLHLRTHAREELLACNCCNKRFIHKLSLRAHLRIHTDEKMKYVIRPFM